MLSSRVVLHSMVLSNTDEGSASEVQKWQQEDRERSVTRISTSASKPAQPVVRLPFDPIENVSEVLRPYSDSSPLFPLTEPSPFAA